MKLGFVGIGTMGQPIATRMIAAGHELTVFDVVEAACRPLVDQGATQATSLSQVTDGCRVIFLSLPGPVEIEQIVAGDNGLLATGKPGDIIVDLSTNSLEVVRRLYGLARDKGMHFLDAPVSGGAAGAVDGTLSIMVGGDKEIFDGLQEVLGCFAQQQFFIGESGSGTMVKLVNNSMFLCGNLLVQEAMVLGTKAGLDIDQLLNVVNASSGKMFAPLAALIFSRKFDTPLFKLNIAEKDVGLAVQTAKGLGVSMPMIEAGHGLYARANEMGLGDEVFFATLKALEASAGVEVAVPTPPAKPA